MTVFLDCTFRDGGYYNDWDFDESLVNQYLEVMGSCGVDVVELGFRSQPVSDTYLGANYYTSENYLSFLSIPDGLKVAVMVNAAELLRGGDSLMQVKNLFPVEASKSRVSIVRIAAHAREIEFVLEALECLIEKGYSVILNVMQIAGRTDREIASLLAPLKDTKLDALYFADSFGALNPERLKGIVNAFKLATDIPLGFHAHDNLGLALHNTLTALDLGVEWVDSTISGMGRGPGNTKTEELMAAVQKVHDRAAGYDKLVTLADLGFAPLRAKFKWGKNPHYVTSALNNIHPSYIQYMEADTRFSSQDISQALSYLSERGGSSFIPEQIELGFQYSLETDARADFSIEEMFGGKELLLIASGLSLNKHKKALELFVNKYQPLVASLNIGEAHWTKRVDYIFACHPMRILSEYPHYKNQHAKLIAPISQLPKGIQAQLQGIEKFDFPIDTSSSEFKLNISRAIVPSNLVVGYALSALAAAGAETIYLAGFDGYPDGDKRNQEMNELLAAFFKEKFKTRVVTILPTNYQVLERSSVYALL